LLLLVAEICLAVLSLIFAAFVWFGWVTPWLLLFFMFLIGAASAITAPSWQSIVPSLVHKRDLPAAVSLNSVGINISRAIGPALGGLLISAWGIVLPPVLWL